MTSEHDVNFDGLESDSREIPTADIEIYGLKGMPSVILTCRPTTDRNEKYFNAWLRRTRRIGRAVSAKTTKKMRALDRDLFARFCIVDWSGVMQNDEAVPWSRPACLAFMRALPDDIYEEFWIELRDPMTFRNSNEDVSEDEEESEDYWEESEDEEEDLAGN